MFFKFLVMVGIESLFNIFLYCLFVLKMVCLCLLGKVLCVEVKGFLMLLILVFSECQVDVLGEWAGDVDCIVIVYVSVLLKFCDCQQFIVLICSGELEVQGDIQVV